jgi:acetolactate synthase I/II/III large subunit
VRDDGYGMIRWKQAEMDFPSFGMTVGNPDFVRYAEAYGASGHRPTTASELGPLLDRCLSTPGVHVIDVPIDYSEDQRALGDDLRAVAARA